MKTFGIGVVISLVALALVINVFPIMLDGIHDMRSDATTVTNNSTTGVGETTEDVTLTTPLLEDSVSYVTSVTSDSGSDTPVAGTYSSSTDVLTITGLAASGTRVLTINYTGNVIDDYTGLENVAKVTPLMLYIAVIFGGGMLAYGIARSGYARKAYQRARNIRKY